MRGPFAGLVCIGPLLGSCPERRKRCFCYVCVCCRHLLVLVIIFVFVVVSSLFVVVVVVPALLMTLVLKNLLIENPTTGRRLNNSLSIFFFRRLPVAGFSLCKVAIIFDL